MSLSEVSILIIDPCKEANIVMQVTSTWMAGLENINENFQSSKSVLSISPLKI